MESEQRNVKDPLLDFASALRLTLKAWPVIAAATIGLCYLTQLVAGWFGVTLPDQANIDLVRNCAGWNWTFASLCFQVLVLMPALEECYFRHLLFRLPQNPLSRPNQLVAAVPPLLILLVGLGVQSGMFESVFPRSRIVAEFPNHPWLCMWTGLALIAAAEYAVRVFGGRLLARWSPYAIMAASSALFSAAHYLAQPFPDSAFLALVFFGLAQCWLYRKTGHLWCAMLNHGLFNLTNLILLFLLPQT